MKRPRHASKATYHPQAFGGWGDYQTWADHDFLPKPPEPDSADPDSAASPAGAPEQPDSPDPADSPEDSPDFDEPAEPVPYADPPTLPDAWGPEDAEAPKPRPYVRTGGRTRAAHELRLETLLSTVGGPPHLGDQTQRALRELCRAPVSVAEIAARLGVPLGVARVLISDAITARHLLVHEPAVGRGEQPSLDLLHRVAEGLRRLR